MNFVDLRISNPILNALEDLEFVYPTPIQAKCFRRISSGNDVVGIAQTGTGKTFAYLLPILSRLEFSKQKHPRIIIIVPTRELVMQVKEAAETLCKYKDVRIKAVYGGANINTQKEYIYRGGTDIIIGTPGRLYDIAVTGMLRLNDIKNVVIDEVDEMLSLGFRPQLEQIFEMLPRKRQHMMFSATLSKDVEFFINEYFYEPEKVEVDSQSTPVEKINQTAVLIPNFTTKIDYLEKILGQEEFKKNLIFVSNKKQADLIFEKISPLFEGKIGVIHSNKSQNFRFNAIKKFEKGQFTALIATDVVARGLDFNEISHVINMTLPEVPSDYIHRIGRTGRAEKDGNAISFVAPYEEDIYNAIKEIAGPNLEEDVLPENIKVSNILLEDEQNIGKHKNYLKTPSIKSSGGAFHEKSDKRLKENSGGLRKKANKKHAKRSGKVSKRNGT